MSLAKIGAATLQTLSSAFQAVPGIAKVMLPAEYEAD
jgi:hypothetical protein